jgi:tetratricopeptide (TPR) repeat protein
LIGLKRFEEEITYFDKAIEIDPKEGYAWNQKGDALDALC